MTYKFITEPLWHERTEKWYVAFGKYPFENEQDFLTPEGTIKRRYIEVERVFRRKINALKYIGRVRKKHWKDFFKVQQVQLN